MKPPSMFRRTGASDSKRANWRSSRTAAAGGAWQTPSVILGSDHPLTRAVDGLDSVGRQSRAVGAVLLGSVIDVTQGVAWAAAAALSAAIVLVGLAVVAAACLQRQRDRALDLIIEGDEGVPVEAVQHERQRLHAPGTQRRLAGAIDRMVDQALNPPNIRGRGTRPLFEITVVALVADDLRAISRLLRTEHASVRGVALAERLVNDGTSALYRDQADALRGQLDPSAI
jgi:hypothetical protein